MCLTQDEMRPSKLLCDGVLVGGTGGRQLRRREVALSGRGGWEARRSFGVLGEPPRVRVGLASGLGAAVRAACLSHAASPAARG